MEAEERYSSRHQPAQCPACGSPRIATILYGLPSEPVEDEEQFVLGGCCITGFDPTWRCLECSTRIYSDGVRDEFPE